MALHYIAILLWFLRINADANEVEVSTNVSNNSLGIFLSQPLSSMKIFYRCGLSIIPYCGFLNPNSQLSEKRGDYDFDIDHLNAFERL